MYITAVVCHLTRFVTVAHGVEFIGVLSIGGAMFGDHRHVSIMGVVALCFSLIGGVVDSGCCTFFLVFSTL